MRLALPEIIRSGRIYLQRLRYEFAEEIFYAYASKPEATRFVSWPTHNTIETTRQYLAYTIPAWAAGTDYSYIIRQVDSNRLVGSIGCINDYGKVQFGYILSPAVWGNGYATEACQALLPLLAKQANVYRIWTFTDVENVASQRVLLKNGLIEEARLSSWFRFINQQNAPKDCLLFKLPDHFLAGRLVTQ